MFYKESCSEKFRNIHRKTPVPESLFNKVAGLRPSTLLKKRPGAACNFIKKETLAQVFSCEFYELSKDTFFYRTPSVAASVVDLGRFHRCNIGELV